MLPMPPIKGTRKLHWNEASACLRQLFCLRSGLHERAPWHVQYIVQVVYDGTELTFLKIPTMTPRLHWGFGKVNVCLFIPDLLSEIRRMLAKELVFLLLLQGPLSCMPGISGKIAFCMQSWISSMRLFRSLLGFLWNYLEDMSDMSVDGAASIFLLRGFGFYDFAWCHLDKEIWRESWDVPVRRLRKKDICTFAQTTMTQRPGHGEVLRSIIASCEDSIYILYVLT